MIIGMTFFLLRLSPVSQLTYFFYVTLIISQCNFSYFKFDCIYIYIYILLDFFTLRLKQAFIRKRLAS